MKGVTLWRTVLQAPRHPWVKKSVAVICICIFLFPVYSVFRDHKQKRYGLTDFAVFYTAGYIVRDDTPKYAQNGIYKRSVFLPVLKSLRKEDGGTKFLYPPQAAVLFAPWTLLPLGKANAIWLLVNTGSILLSYSLVALALLKQRWHNYRYSIGLAVLAVADPVHGLLRTGQINGMVLLLLVVSIVLLQKKSHLAATLAGAALAIATGLKIFPAIFVLPLIVLKRWYALLGYVITTALLWAATLPRFGLRGMYDFYIYPLGALLGGKINDVSESPSIYGTIRKLLRDDFLAWLPMKKATIIALSEHGLSLLAIIAVLAIGYALYTRRYPLHLMYSALMCTVLLFSKGIQSQFLLWMLPLGIFWVSTWYTLALKRKWGMILYQSIAIYCLFFWTLVPAINVFFYKRLILIGLLLAGGWLIWYMVSNRKEQKTLEDINTLEQKSLAE